MNESVGNLERLWSTLCLDAGWADSLYCTADGNALKTYEHKLDALVASREADIRQAIAAAYHGAQGSEHYYVKGIEAALERAIANPR